MKMNDDRKNVHLGTYKIHLLPLSCHLISPCFAQADNDKMQAEDESLITPVKERHCILEYFPNISKQNYNSGK